MLECLWTGTDFYDVYTGVGARRIRETFEMLRNFAPAVLFIDEFDALGAARGAAAAGDESASIINEMLVQVSFEGGGLRGMKAPRLVSLTTAAVEAPVPHTAAIWPQAVFRGCMSLFPLLQADQIAQGILCHFTCN